MVKKAHFASKGHSSLLAAKVLPQQLNIVDKLLCV
jgi:hypothetical protein